MNTDHLFIKRAIDAVEKAERDLAAVMRARFPKGTLVSVPPRATGEPPRLGRVNVIGSPSRVWVLTADEIMRPYRYDQVTKL